MAILVRRRERRRCGRLLLQLGWQYSCAAERGGDVDDSFCSLDGNTRAPPREEEMRTTEKETSGLGGESRCSLDGNTRADRIEIERMRN
jgi:hypothetical protein